MQGWGRGMNLGESGSVKIDLAGVRGAFVGVTGCR